MLTNLVLSLTLMTNASLTLDEYLMRAIDRGVPLFNSGNPEACAAVYATALEGVANNPEWGLAPEQRANLTDHLDFNVSTSDPVARAWAYRRLIDAVLSGEPISPLERAETLELFGFSEPEELRRWRIVLDGVMGGLSTGDIEIENAHLVFAGETSLRNNGGFSSIRAPIPAGSLAGYEALRIRVKGDGRTYIIGARTGNGRGDSYWTRFETVADDWVTVTAPIREMQRHFFGRPIQGRLQPAAIAGLEFYIYDGEEGPFRLEIDRIEALR